MHDPFPIAPPPQLVRATTPLAEFLSLSTLPIHIHELLLAALSYHLICVYVSPFLSRRLFPSVYPSLPLRSQVNWDVHVVSLVQSVVVCAAAIWIMIVDKERKSMGWEERIWGYTGADGMIQAFAAGYFLWDLQICLRYLGIFGPGLLMHAIAALIVFSLGFVRHLPRQTSEAPSLLTDDRGPSSITTPPPSSSMNSHPPFSTFIGFSTSCR